MKCFLLLIWCIGFARLALAQDDTPKEVTPQVLQKIKTEVEKEAAILKLKLSKDDFSLDRVEFSTDTFRIEQIVSKRIDIDYSTAGMNTAVSEKTTAYDKLLNKYYNKLLKSLNAEDKKVLISAQKAWLAYRDAELALIGTMTKEEYSGGGTIQSMIAIGAYSGLVVRRTVEIFNYFDGIMKEE